MLRKLFPLFFLCLAYLPVYAQNNQTASVRYIYFSEEYNINSNLQNALQNSLLNAKGYSIEKVERLPTFFNNSAYILNPSPELTEEELNNSVFYYRSSSKEDVIITPSSLMIQEPAEDKNITKPILDNSSEDPNSFVVARPFTAIRGQITLPSGVYDVIATDRNRLTSEWVPAVLVKYHINTPKGQSIISVFEKPLGGIGAWYDTLKKIEKQAPQKTIVINTGGLQVYAPLNLEAQFLADYWKETGADIVAPSPKDIDILWSVLEQKDMPLPPLLATNAEPINSDSPNPFTKTQVIERDGVKTGFFALMDTMALSTAAGRNIPLKSTDIFEAAKAAVSKLRNTEKVDFVVLVSHMKEDSLNRLLTRQYGIDMVITAKKVDNYSLRNRKIELTDWNKERHLVPAYTSRGNGYILGDTQVDFDKDSLGSFTPVLIEDLPPTNLYDDNTFSNKFYAINKKLFSGLSAEGEGILPPAGVLAKAAGCSAALTYSPAEVFNIAASIIREQTKSEVSIVKIQNFKRKIFGSVHEHQLAAWLSESPEPILKVRIKGEDLKNILKFVDFSNACSAPVKDYEETFTLAAAGVVPDDDKYKINGLTLNDDEFYFLTMPANILEERVVLPSLRKCLTDIKETGETLPEIVVNYLKKLKEDNTEAAYKMFNNYLEDYYTRKETGLPPQDAAAMILDQNMEDLGPLAAQEYFTEQMKTVYTEDLVKLMKKDIPPVGIWRYNLKNLALQFTNTNINNSAYYKDFPNSRLNSDSQTLIQGSLNFAAEYYRDNIRWDNSVLLQYGKITLRPIDGPRVVNESMDKILISTEYTYKSTTIKHFLGGFLMGPFLSLGYETEFTHQDNAPRYKVLRGKGGARLFEGEYLKDLYLAIVPELDFTYPESSTKYAWEFGIKVEQPIADNTKAIYRAMIRDFFILDTNSNTNLSYELELDARLEMEVWKKFSIAPFVNYYQAKASDFDRTGSNLFIGVSLSYSRLFKHIPF